MANESNKNTIKNANPKRSGKIKPETVFAYIGIAVGLIILVLLLVNSLLSCLVPVYHTPFFGSTLIKVDNNDMPQIPRGTLILVQKPDMPEEIATGDILSFEVKNDRGAVVHIYTRRVKAVSADGGKYVFTMLADAQSADIDNPQEYEIGFDSVIGVYAGGGIAGLGYFFGFLDSPMGALVLFLILAAIALLWLIQHYIAQSRARRDLVAKALGKSATLLGGVNLRYDNIREITAVMDVLEMLSVVPKAKAEDEEIRSRLRGFIDAASIELPQTPETAAMLDSLPAPDTPVTLAAALRSGATLRQAEDGQTLILTGMSGGKSILLTPIQTADGIILCQQGVRLKSDLAPNIENIGIVSMPSYPEFFEGKPIEKNIDYPELPEPQGVFGPQLLNGVATDDEKPRFNGEDPKPPVPIGGAALAISSEELPKAVRAALPESEDGKPRGLPRGEDLPDVIEMPPASHSAAYARYRASAAELELRQVEQLSALLAGAKPLTVHERKKLDDHNAKKAAAETEKQRKPRKPLTEEQKKKRKAAAEKRKIEKAEFLAALTPADRELYESEQKLAKARAATIKKLKKISSDRKALNALDTANNDTKPQ